MKNDATFNSVEAQSIAIGTTKDDINKFAVNANSSLFTSSNLSDPNVKVVINKDSSGAVSSIHFTRNNILIAEIGCLGNDDLTFSVIKDGKVGGSISLSKGGVSIKGLLENNGKIVSLLDNVYIEVDAVIEFEESLPNKEGLYIFKTSPVEGLPTGIKLNTLVKFDLVKWYTVTEYIDIPYIINSGNTLYFKSDGTFTQFERYNINVPIGTIIPYLSLEVPKDFVALNGQKLNKSEYSDLWRFAVSNNLTSKDVSRITKFIDLNDYEFNVPNLKNSGLIEFDPIFSNKILDVNQFKYADGGNIKQDVFVNFIMKSKDLIDFKKFYSNSTISLSTSKDKNCINLEAKKLSYNNYSLLTNINSGISNNSFTCLNKISFCYADGKIDSLDSFSVDLKNCNEGVIYYLVKEEISAPYLTPFNPIESFIYPAQGILENQIFVDLSNPYRECKKKINGKLLSTNCVKLGEIIKVNNKYTFTQYAIGGIFNTEINVYGKDHTLEFNHNIGFNPAYLSCKLKILKDNFVKELIIPSIMLNEKIVRLDLEQTRFDFESILYITVLRDL